MSKKQEVINLIENLDGFLDNIKSISLHPYSQGVDTNKLVDDLKTYISDMKAVAEGIEEISVDFEGEPDREENSK